MSSPEIKWKTVESGPHTYEDALHPVVLKNYGKWKYHEIPKPGVLKHVAESGVMSFIRYVQEHPVRIRWIWSEDFAM